RLLDLPARGSPGSAGEHDGRSRALGCRPREPGLRDRRPHRHQGRGRRRRHRVGGALAVLRRSGGVKLLLTSAGIKNASIADALRELLGKPIAESDALCIPTGLYGHPMAGPRQAWRVVSGRETRAPMIGLGWKSIGVLELTALPSLEEERWVTLVRETDVLLVEGGDAAYLCHWLRASGL